MYVKCDYMLQHKHISDILHMSLFKTSWLSSDHLTVICKTFASWFLFQYQHQVRYGDTFIQNSFYYDSSTSVRIEYEVRLPNAQVTAINDLSKVSRLTYRFRGGSQFIICSA